MTPRDLQRLLPEGLKQGIHFIIAGQPGIGKTKIPKQIIQDVLGWDLLMAHPATDDPIDYKGLPFISEGVANFFDIGVIRLALEATRDTVLFFDDVGQAPQSVQAALMQYADPRGRVLNNKRLPDCVRLLFATNRRDDRAGVGGFLEPFKDRCCIVQLDVSIEDWTVWAAENEIRPEIIAYVNWRPENLSNFQAATDLTVSPSPRSWEHMNDLMNLPNLPDLDKATGSLAMETFTGTVGKSAAAEFISFCRTFRNLPTITQIEDKPNSARVPKEKSEQYAATLLVANRVQHPAHNLAGIMDYLRRFEPEFRVLWTELGMKYNANIADTKEFTKWALEHQEYMAG